MLESILACLSCRRQKKYFLV